MMRFRDLVLFFAMILVGAFTAQPKVFAQPAHQLESTGAFDNIRINYGVLYWSQGDKNFFLPPVQAESGFTTVTVADPAYDVLKLTTGHGPDYLYDLNLGLLILKEASVDGEIKIQPGVIVMAAKENIVCGDDYYTNRGATAYGVVLAAGKRDVYYFGDGSLTASVPLRDKVADYLLRYGCKGTPVYNPVGNLDKRFAGKINVINPAKFEYGAGTQSCLLKASEGTFSATVLCNISTSDIELNLGESYAMVADQQFLLRDTKSIIQYVHVGSVAFLPLKPSVQGQTEYIAPLLYVGLDPTNGKSSWFQAEVQITILKG